MFVTRPMTKSPSKFRVSAKLGRWWLMAAAAIVLPQLSSLVWWMRTQSTLHFRGWINGEYLVLFAIGVLFPSRAMVGVLAAELTLSLLEPIGHLYYFSPSDAVLSLQYLQYLPAPRLAGYGAFLVAYIILCVVVLAGALGSERPARGPWIAAVLILCAVLPIAADAERGRFHAILGLNHRDPDLRSVHVVSAPMLSLVAGVLGKKGVDAPQRNLRSALGAAMSEIPRDAVPNVVLVLTESWGLSSDARVNDALTAPYSDAQIAASYTVQRGTVEFSGGTTHGETRELCGDTRGRNRYADVPALAGCWPGQLDRRGYRTLAVHGFAPTMFERKSWYENFGFEESAFLPELQRDGVTMCPGAFPGGCDADVMRWISARLMQTPEAGPLFVHWVTLNSHLPVTPVEVGYEQSGCGAVGLAQGTSLCGWFGRVRIVHQSVGEAALRAIARDGQRPTMFVVVGDHAPPFLTAANRDRFSQTRVPFVVLMPRSLSRTSPTRMVASM